MTNYNMTLFKMLDYNPRLYKELRQHWPQINEQTTINLVDTHQVHLAEINGTPLPLWREVERRFDIPRPDLWSWFMRRLGEILCLPGLASKGYRSAIVYTQNHPAQGFTETIIQLETFSWYDGQNHWISLGYYAAQDILFVREMGMYR